MPLPDERPRQSVANLIGRFEQQVKKNPTPAAVPGTPPSVGSNITGDRAKEEIKEKREWAPRPSVAQGTPSPIVPSSSWTRAQRSPPVPLQTSPPAVVAEQTPATLKVEPPTPASATAPAPPSPMAAPAPQRRASTDSNLPAKPTLPPGSATPGRTSAVRSSIAGNSKPPPKDHSVKSPPRSSVSISPSQPTLKPQHTGQSTASTSAARSPKVGTRTVPSTPSRSKTPSSFTPRPKTPSTGLFAPTAASLARARNAPELPTPVKKAATISSSASERLSKPTAASLSKARSPPPAATTPAHRTPSRVVSGNRGGAPAKGVLKQKAAPAAKGNQELDANKPEAGDAVDVESRDGADHSENGHDLEALVLSESIPSLAPPREDAGEILGVDDVALPSEANEGALDLLNEEKLEEEKEEQLEEEKPEANGASPNASREPTPPLHSRETTLNVEQESFSNKEERLDEVKARAEDDHLDDMVNFLEAAPLSKARPLSIASIPDEEVQEIPDEE